jgi:outer membrane protein
MTQKLLLPIGILNLLAIIGLSIFIFFKNDKVVYVHSGKLLNNYQGMIDARAAFQKKATAWNANVDTLVNEVQKQIFRFERDSRKMTLKERQLSEELIRAKQKQLSDYQQAATLQAKQEDEKMTTEVVARVNAYLKLYGESNGYQIILAATDYGNLAYAHTDLDITEKVLDGLNKEYQGK